MDIQVSDGDGISIIALTGNFDIASAKPFDEELTALADAGNNKIVLDFSEVGFIASTGLRVLLKAAQRVKVDEGALVVCCVGQTVADVFSMTGFDTILAIYETRESAVEALNG